MQSLAFNILIFYRNGPLQYHVYIIRKSNNSLCISKLCYATYIWQCTRKPVSSIRMCYILWSMVHLKIKTIFRFLFWFFLYTSSREMLHLGVCTFDGFCDTRLKITRKYDVGLGAPTPLSMHHVLKTWDVSA